MRYKRVLRRWGALVLLLTFAVPLAAHADPPRERDRERGGGELRLARVLTRHAERLELDVATLEKIQALARADESSREALRKSLREERQAMRRLLSAERPDEGAVMQRAEAAGTLETEAHKQRLRTMLQIRALLTPEQLEALGTIRDEERQARRGDRQRRRGGFGRSERGATPDPEPR
jgi:Spy/CpxP family protein refolding chaperone